MALAARIKKGDAEAAAELLAHSISLGHRKLTARRYFLAQAMDAVIPHEYARYCANILKHLPQESINIMMKEEQHRADLYMKRRRKDV